MHTLRITNFKLKNIEQSFELSNLRRFETVPNNARFEKIGGVLRRLFKTEGIEEF